MKFLSCLASAFTTTACKLYRRSARFVPSVKAAGLGTSARAGAAARAGTAAFAGVVAFAIAAGSATPIQAQMTATTPVFPATAVGSATTPQTVLLTTTSAETIMSITVPASQGNKQEYTVGAVSGCAVDGTTVNPIGTTCRVPITFAPAYPGARVAPLRVVTGAGSINFALNATGNGPLSVLSPGHNTIIAGGCTTNCAAQDADGVLAANETLSVIFDMRLNSAGDIYFINGPGLRKISGSSGIVTTIAGIGNGSGSLVLGPVAIALDPRGNIDVAEFGAGTANGLVQQMNGATGAVTTIAGELGYQSTSTYGNVPTPGPATKSPLPALTDVASDASGNVYIGTYSQILRIDAATGILSYVAGTPNVRNYTGDGGLATTALVNMPTGLAFDPSGNLFFSDSTNLVIRRIDAVTGIITTVAGNPNGTENEGYVGSPTGTLIAPHGLAFDAAGNLYLNDTVDRFLGIRRIDAATSIMTTIAGSGYYVTKGANGLRATDAFNVSGFALDSLGNLITYSQGTNLSSISKVDTSSSAISFPYTSNSAAAAFPYVGTAYPNATRETVNVTNIGNSSLSILSPASGNDPVVTGAAYKLDDPAMAGCPSVAAGMANVSLAPGTSCFLAVDFTPTLVGPNTGQIVLTDNSLNAASSTKTIVLSGSGTALPITLSPAALTFPDTVAGSSSPTQTITVTNAGDATTLMVAVSISGANAASFSQTNTCNTYLFPAATCTITITFSPTAVASNQTAVVTFSSDYPTPSQTATLTGNGVAANTPVAPTATVTLLPAAPYYSDTVTVTTTLTGPAGTAQPTGTITYKVDTGSTGTATLTAGAAASLAYLQIVPQIPGVHTLSFTYSGDGNYASTTTTPQVVTFTVADRPFAFIAGNYPLNPYITDDLKGSGFVYDYYASGIAVDPLGNVYLSTGTTDGGTPGITKIDTNQILTTVPVTGLGANTQLAIDNAANLYIADPANGRVIVYSKAGVQTVLPATGLVKPAALMFDAANNSLVILDTAAGTIFNYNLTTAAQTTLLSGLTQLSAMVATDGKGALFYVQNAVLMEYVPGSTTVPIFGEFTNMASNAFPKSLAFNETTGDLFIGGNGGSASQNVIRVDKLHHMIYIGSSQNSQITVDNLGEVYATGVVMSPGAAADGGPGIYGTSQGYSGSSPEALFSVPYNHGIPAGPSPTYGYPGAFGAVKIMSSQEHDLPLGPVAYSLTATTDNGLKATVPVYGIGFGPLLATDLGTVSTAPFGTFGSIGGLAYNEQTVGGSKIYVTDKTKNTVNSIVFVHNPSAGAGFFIGTPQTLAFAGLKAPTQITVDGALDVYVLDSGALNGGSRILRLDYANNQTTVYTADTGDAAGLLGSITAFTLDGATNLYFGGTDKNGKGVIVRQDAFGNESLRASNINTPTLLTIDALHTLFATDAAGNLTRVDAAGNATTLATGLGVATSLSIDPSDTAYLTSVSGQTITTVSTGGVVGAVAVPGTTHPALAVVEDLGSLFVADSAQQQVLVDERSKGNINFGTIAVGATATQNDTVRNIGNLALAPFTLTSAAPFSIVPATSNGCLDSTNAKPTALVPGSSCGVQLRYSPTMAATDTGTAKLSVPNDAIYGYNTNVDATWQLSGTASATATLTAALTPASADFGSTPAGSTAVQTFTLTNTGTASLTISSVALGGANAGVFTITARTCGSTVAAGATCTISVAFTPASAGSYSATLTVLDNASGGMQMSSLTATGTAAGTLSISPVTQVFPATAVGASTAIQTSTIRNTTAQAIYLSSGSLTDATDFTQSDNCNGLVAAATGTCTVSFTFTPKTAGALISTYAIHDLNNPGLPLSVALSGNGTSALAPQAVLSPQSLTFTTVPNTQASNQTLTLSNPGTATLTIASILLTGANTPSFAIVTNACGGTLTAGAACTITLGCTAIVTGTYTASLTVTDNATPPTQSALLTCNVSGAPQASLAPAAVTFGNVNVGAKSAASTITLTNAGTVALPIGSISLQGTNAASYAITGNACPTSLAAGASCAVAVAFSPTVAGGTSATLVVIDAVGTQTSALSGTGIATATATPDFTIAATPARAGYRGTSVSYTVQLASLLSSNPFGNAVTLSATGLPAGAAVSFAPATVVPGIATASTSVMTIAIPALSAALHEPANPSRWPRGSTPAGATVLAAIACCYTRKRKTRSLQRLSTIVCLLGGAACAAMLGGCGANNGFGVPSTTSVITVTATSGNTVHSTQVTLTIQ